MNASTNQFQESVVSHPRATDTAAARSGLVPAEQCGAPFHVPDEVVICLPMPPTTNNLFVNSARAGRVKSPEYRAWLNEAGHRLNRQRPPQTRGEVSLLIEVGQPQTKHHMDLANREKACVDLLVKHLVIQGDDQRYVRELNMRWASDIRGVRVTIRPLASVNGGGVV